MNIFSQIKQGAYQSKEWVKMLFKYPAMKLEKVDYDAYWQSKRGTEIGRLSDWQEARARIIAAALPKDIPLAISDIGSGDGSILAYLREKINLKEGIAVDMSSFALDKARSSGFTTLKLDINDTKALVVVPLCDYALMLEILEHIPASEEFLALMLGKSRRGVFFSFPNTGFFVHRFRLLFGRFPLQWRLHPGEHLRYWTVRDLRWWLRSLGYADRADIHFYKGIPILNKIWPGMFAAAFVIEIRKS